METKNITELKPGVTLVSADNKKRDPGRTGTLLVVTGPSGVGKGTVVGKTLESIDRLAKSVSVTTRSRRNGEEEGVHYFYRSEKEFFDMRDRGEFLESAEFAGHYYGTPSHWVDDMLKHGIDVILEIEVQGAMQVREKRDDAVLIFLSPPSFDALAERLRTRATESEEKIRERLKKAEGEIKQRHLFNYEVINDNLTEAIRNLESIVYAERLRI
ncbi:MAG: guanylate kinase [Candidatus Melainabacteria bacterium]|nr:guanylate kinase [Candidatus Melainabacteria bacterium]